MKKRKMSVDAGHELAKALYADGRTVSNMVALIACRQAGKDSAHLGQVHVASSVSHLRWGRMNSPGQEVPFKVTNLDIGRYVYVISSCTQYRPTTSHSPQIRMV